MSSSGNPGLFPEAASEAVAPKASASKTAEWLSAHCDGGARGNPGPSGYGAVIQDASGQVLTELSVFLGIKTNNFAEYSGLLGVLEWTLANGHTHLRVVSDSELMVKQIQGKYKVNSPDLRPLWEEARRRIGKLERFEISHALRHKNKTADRLANEAMDRGMGKAPGGTSSRPAPSGNAGSGSSAAPSANRAPSATPYPKAALRGRIHNGTIQLLDGATLPEGAIVKIIPE